ncbi:MAG TPA: nitroreductase family deazaflavin-dependent oxidoreductase [Solirubrobacterales bacterium]|nr:nitroreductase family deazaflavin-dependent oxidoreductase [Solirubrobacterales bacterium]
MTPTTAGSRSEPLYLRYADQLWPVTNRLAGAHAFLYRRTGGRLGARVPGGRGRLLLLDHVGAKTGTLRTTPLLYILDGDNLVLLASKGGFPRHPAWFHNLRAHPLTYVQVGPDRRRVRARPATPEERPHLWAKAVAVWPGYDDYRARTDREIPLVVLEPDRA